MNPVRKAIEDRLHSDATLVSLLGDPVSPFSAAIYARQAPQTVTDENFPLILISKQSGLRTWAFRGQPMRPEVWLVKAVHKGSSGAAEDIDSRCEDLLNDAALDVTSFAVLYLRRDSDVDLRENADGEAYYHVGGEYRLVTERSY